jgi:uncharacterized membrane protein
MNAEAASLQRQIDELRAQLARVEYALAQRGVTVEQAVRVPEPAQPVSLPVGPPVAPPAFTATASSAPATGATLENRIGTQWFNRIGIIAVLVGAAWFLKLAIDNNWIGPALRVLVGLLTGIGLVAWSERFRRRSYLAFAYSLKGVGSGILYLSLWAAFDVYHLLPSGAAFAAMIAVTVFNGLLAWYQNAELLALYAIVGGMSTRLLLSTGHNHEAALFTYLLMLDCAVLALLATRPWSRLLTASFAGTAIFFAGWWASYYSDSQSGMTACFVLCFFLIFAFSPRLVLLPEAASRSLWQLASTVLLPIANACLGFAAAYAIYVPSQYDLLNHHAPGANTVAVLLALMFAVFYAAILRVPRAGPLQASSSELESVHLTLAILFATLALPLKTQGRWLTAGWILEGTALLWVATRSTKFLLRELGLVILLLGLALLTLLDKPASVTPIFNQRFAAYCIAIACTSFICWTAHRMSSPTSRGGHPLPWDTVAAAMALVTNGLVLLAVSYEIHNYWWAYRTQLLSRVPSDYRILSQFTYSAFFMAYGTLLMMLGFWRRSAFLRWQALVLLAVAIAKVFLVDVSQLSEGFRIVSFLGLGVLLLAVSFLYQRDLLNLRRTDSSV